MAIGIGVALALAECESTADKQQREAEEYAVSTAAMCRKTRDLSEQLEAARSLAGKPQRGVDGREFWPSSRSGVTVPAYSSSSTASR